MATNIGHTPPLAARLPSATTLLACAAVPLLAYEGWTIAGWLVAGPSQITAYRDHGSTSLYAARVVEVAVVASVAWWLVHVLRERRRTGRLGVDGLLIAGMFSAAFWDPIYNWLDPAWLYSSHFLNVNDWFGHAPFVLNKDAGRLPWPVVVVIVGYPLWCVGFAAIVNAAMAAARHRRPATPNAALAVLAFVLAGAITVAAFAGFRALDLMAAPGYKLEALGGEELLVFFWSGGLVFGGWPACGSSATRAAARWSSAARMVGPTCSPRSPPASCSSSPAGA